GLYAANTGALSSSVANINQRTSESTMADRDDFVDTKIAAAEARKDTKIVRLEGAINTALATIVGKIDALSVQVSDQRRDRNVIIGTIVLSALALGGLVWGAATYGDALFGRGMNVRDVVQSVVREQQQIQERTQQQRPNTPR
ncbi:MAG TPA: hypothetical protein VHT51_06730, partial [Micropepsaceae bacterium]|nr:hypothetical protein [Micropepsaceae bacterium]